jgi:hypothetical protein
MEGKKTLNKNIFIVADDSLIEYAKRRAEEIMMETQGFIAYSPAYSKECSKECSIEKK